VQQIHSLNITKSAYYIAQNLQVSLLITSEEIRCQSYVTSLYPQISTSRYTNTGISTENAHYIVDTFVQQELRNTVIS